MLVKGFVQSVSKGAVLYLQIVGYQSEDLNDKEKETTVNLPMLYLQRLKADKTDFDDIL